MYVLFIARGYPTKKYKTHGIFEFDQAKALADNGCKVVYAAIDVRSIRRWRKWGIEHHEVDGVNIHAINIPGGRVSPSVLRQLRTKGLDLLFKKICEFHGEPDILHAHFTGPGYTGKALKEKTGIPLVVTEHSSQINKSRIEPRRYVVAKEAYLGADTVIAVSPVLARRIEQHFGISPVIIPNIVDIDVFKQRSKKNGDGRFRMVSTGNLIRSKRMDLLIACFARTFRYNSSASLAIFGDGSERKALERQIRKLGMEDQVQLMGLTARKEIAKTLAESDCFVLASESETFGVAYIEALASGIPVIATRCGGPEFFVDTDNGILIDVDNRDQLVRAMRFMYQNVAKYDAEMISWKVRQRFSPNGVAEQIKQLYEKVLE